MNQYNNQIHNLQQYKLINPIINDKTFTAYTMMNAAKEIFNEIKKSNIKNISIFTIQNISTNETFSFKIHSNIPEIKINKQNIQYGGNNDNGNNGLDNGNMNNQNINNQNLEPNNELYKKIVMQIATMNNAIKGLNDKITNIETKMNNDNVKINNNIDESIKNIVKEDNVIPPTNNNDNENSESVDNPNEQKSIKQKDDWCTMM